MRIVYYTSGKAGTGRIVRGISVYNGLQRKGVISEFIILSSSNYANIADQFNIPHVEIPFENETIITRTNYPNSVLYKTLLQLKPDILIVDRMWFTLQYFIEELHCRKIFLTIQVHDRFFKIDLPEETIAFNNRQYDRVIAIEPFKCIIKTETINPIIIRNRNEIYDRYTALQKFNLSGSKPVCLIALNFKEGYLEKMKHKYSYLEDEGYDVIYTSNLKGGGIFPMVDYFNAVDLIICAGGYNQFWEVIYFDKETVFETSLPKLAFTDLQWRIDNCQEYYFDENGADQLADIMMNL